MSTLQYGAGIHMNKSSYQYDDGSETKFWRIYENPEKE